MTSRNFGQFKAPLPPIVKLPPMAVTSSMDDSILDLAIFLAIYLSVNDGSTYLSTILYCIQRSPFSYLTVVFVVEITDHTCLF